MTNPFLAAIVQEAWQTPEVDVPSIHASVFRKCLEAYDELGREGRTFGIIIHGPAGAGKTHILSRLRKYLHEKPPTAPLAYPAFLWVKLDTHPGYLWRHLRRSIVRDLQRPITPAGWSRPLTQLQLLVASRIAKRRGADYDLDLWWDWLLSENPDELEAEISTLAQELNWPLSLRAAVIGAVKGSTEAVAWLRGDALADQALKALGLPTDTEEDPEQLAKQCVLGLLSLADQDQAILLCFDQVEAIVRRPNDTEAIFLLGQLIATLHDATRYVLIVTCVQSSFLMEQLDHIRQADLDRMQSYGQLGLGQPGFEQIRELVRRRLETARIQPPPGTELPLWPIGEDRLREFCTTHMSLTVRDVLRWCRDTFDAVLGEQRRDLSTEKLLDDWFARLVQQPDNLPAPDETTAMLAHALATLVPALYQSVVPLDDPPVRQIDLAFAEGTQELYVVLCTEPNFRRLAPRLREILRWRQRHRNHRLVIVRDERVTLTPHARKTRHYLDQLMRLGHTVILRAEDVRQLNAARRIMAEARTGDLAPWGEAINDQQVEQWLRKRAPEGLRKILVRITNREPANDTGPEVATGGHLSEDDNQSATV